LLGAIGDESYSLCTFPVGICDIDVIESERRGLDVNRGRGIKGACVWTGKLVGYRYDVVFVRASASCR
jgi:hypothetical protein